MICCLNGRIYENPFYDNFCFDNRFYIIRGISMTNPKRILGIDFGAKKVGIAVSDMDGNFAIPKIVLKNDKNLMRNLLEIIEKESIFKIVIGESTNYKGEENPVMKDIRNFVGALKVKFNLPVIFEPEFLTTHQAKSIQEESAMTDASAAALILQSFLDKKNE